MEFVTKPAAAQPAEKRALSPDERARIERVAADHPHGAYLAAMYYLGCRPGEARGLQWGDFDWDSCVVHIQRDIDYKAGAVAGDLKTKKSVRRVPVPDALAQILKPLRGPAEAFLFQGEISGAPLSKTTAERIWVELMLACDMVDPIPEDAPKKYRPTDVRSLYDPIITPHVLRHNYITMCWESGIDVYTTMKLVGHASIKTTMDIYTHLSEAQLEKAGVLVAAMFGSSKSVQRSCNVAQKTASS
jgi:integrase